MGFSAVGGRETSSPRSNETAAFRWKAAVPTSLRVRGSANPDEAAGRDGLSSDREHARIDSVGGLEAVLERTVPREVLRAGRGAAMDDRDLAARDIQDPHLHAALRTGDVGRR